MKNKSIKSNLKGLGIIIFGAIFPIIMLIQAYIGINSLRTSVSYSTQLGDLSEYLSEARESIDNVNDYSLYSLLYVEHANQKTMINKQVMKSTVVLIGFAVISIGLMLLILGFEMNSSDSVDAQIELNDLRFNLKTGSAGVAVFLVGAAMATLGGILKNDYQTSSIPKYVTSGTSKEQSRSLESYKECKKQGKDFQNCFVQLFYQINKEELE